ncbi:MAG: AraC family transcriptional regulator [Acidimicrobiia bacterium]|nr:AraC family transcriptional regulator [Acidimicrobiia bacterium]MYB24349.1 AraC family transcriptional regulator [Acidimicrobiia bacterium]
MEELVSLIAGRAVAEGANESAWSGLSYDRFSSPAGACERVVTTLSVYVVAQGRGQLRLDERACVCGPAEFIVLAQGTRLVTEALEASSEEPLLAAILRIDPVLTIELLRAIEQQPDSSASPRSPKSNSPPGSEPALVSPLGDELAGALARLVRATDTDVDRQVLAPLALRETAYRILRSGQGPVLAGAAQRENSGDRITAAIAFMRDRLGEPIKVEDMAGHVEMSVSSFAHVFKETTGSAPYQYLKRLRLDRARALLVEENQAVGNASRAVGYSTASHFISEFKRMYGETPRSYASRLRRLGTRHSPLEAR